MNWRAVLLVAIGGAVGAVARHGTAALCENLFGERFPWGTLVVNVIGCFLLGWLLHHSMLVSDAVKLAIGTGFLGAFTTFSTFGVQTHHAWQRSPAIALANVSANVILGLVAAGVGMLLASKWNG